MAPPRVHSPCGVRHGLQKTLVSEAFADSLGLRKTMFPEGKSPKVCLGNSDTVTPVAGVEFWAIKDTEDTNSGHLPRRIILASVLRNLPTTILMSGDDLITLGLLPPRGQTTENNGVLGQVTPPGWTSWLTET